MPLFILKAAHEAIDPSKVEYIDIEERRITLTSGKVLRLTPEELAQLIETMKGNSR